MKKCFSNQNKKSKSFNAKHYTVYKWYESNDLLNYCDLSQGWKLLVKECTQFEIEQVLAQGWTNQTLTGFNDNGFICQFVSHDANLNDLPNKWLWPFKTKCAWCCEPQCSFSSFTNQWMNQISTQLADRHPMDVRNPVWPVRLRVQLTINQSIIQSINQSIWVTRYLAIQFKMNQLATHWWSRNYLYVGLKQ